MSEAIATFERVSQACADLLKRGISPSASKVTSEIGGGSKSTVLEHIKRWRRTELPELLSTRDAELSEFQDIAEPFVREIWQTAKQRAEAGFNRQLKSLLLLQEGMQLEIDESQNELTDLRDRLSASEAKLAAKEDSGHKLEELLRTFQELGVHRTPKSTKDLEEPQLSAAMKVVQVVGKIGKNGVLKDVVDQELLTRYELDPPMAQKARHYAMDQGYVALVLTSKGRERFRSIKDTPASKPDSDSVGS